MAWHDSNWNDKVCCDPEGNTYCTVAQTLLSGRIEKRKNLAVENTGGVKGEYIAENFKADNVPPCYWSLNAFSDRDFKLEHHHAFRWVKHT
jgi:hypothetical protein